MANSKKTIPVEKAEVTSDAQRYKGWDMSRIFWGLLLALVGLLVLLDNLGVVEVRYENLWQLWPLLIVGWGVSLLNVRGAWWSVVSALLIAGTLGLLVWAAVGAEPFQETENSTQSQQVDKTTGAVGLLDVNVKAGAGNILIGPGESDAPIKAVLRSDFATLNVDSQSDGSTQKVNVSTEGSRTWWDGSLRNELDIELARQLPIYLKVETGASDLEADMSKLRLERLDLNLGANSSIVTIGNLVDLVDVKLSAGASSITLRVPKDSGVSVKLDKGVSSQDLDGLQDKGDGLYETADFSAASKKITIRGDLGAASFTLERY